MAPSQSSVVESQQQNVVTAAIEYQSFPLSAIPSMVNVGAKHSLYRGGDQGFACAGDTLYGAMSSRRTVQTCRTDDR